MKTKLLLSIPFLAASLLVSPARAKDGAIDPPPSDPAPDKVQIALLLDTSGSMDGLIDQARTQLWKVVNTFAAAKREGRVPFVEVALYEYGNNSLHGDNHWIRQVEPLTRDLDEVSRELFAFRTNGGEEYCGAVIRRALSDLSWDPSPKTYKTIFIAGNEPFTQGPVDVREACRDAIRKGVVVNTIHCGGREVGIAGSWHDGPALAEGKFLSIDQDKAVAHIDAPQDKEISSLGIELNKTYLGYGKQREDASLKQQAADKDAVDNAKAGAAVQRAVTKASANYCNTAWDLVDATREGKVKIEDVSAEDLPEEMKKMTPAERAAHVAKMTEQRAALQNKIRELGLQRDAFVADAMKKQAEVTGEQTLDQAIAETVKGQAKSFGYAFGR